MENTEVEPLFKDYIFYVLPSGLGFVRQSVLKENITKRGGKVLEKEDSNSFKPSHIVIEDSIWHNRNKCHTLLRKIGIDNKQANIVSTKWLSMCFKENKLQPLEDFREEGSDNTQSNREINNSDLNAKCKISSIDSSPPKKQKTSNIQKFAALNIPEPLLSSCNQKIISELEKLAETYRNAGDQWRAHGYDKAIASIKSYNKTIENYEEAASLPGIGKKMAGKIMEIIDNGSLQKVEEVCENEKSKAINLFTKIWGVGPSTACSWYVQGFRTIEDIASKAVLNKQQKIGLKYFEDFQMRISRKDVEHIGNVVCAAALSLKPDLQTVLCGSYRRGKETCGDVDVLLLTDVASSRFLTSLLEKLKKTGFITDDLTVVEDNGGHRKYLGVCRLSSGRHHRLDIFVVPKSESAPALLHYTGSALFNRSLRLLAAEKGMCLSEHYLAAGVVREGSKMLNEGYILDTPTEESIFEHLGLKYRPPEERDQ